MKEGETQMNNSESNLEKSKWWIVSDEELNEIENASMNGGKRVYLYPIFHTLFEERKQGRGKTNDELITILDSLLAKDLISQSGNEEKKYFIDEVDYIKTLLTNEESHKRNEENIQDEKYRKGKQISLKENAESRQKWATTGEID